MSRVIIANETWFKTATYCLMHFTVAIAVAYAISRDWQIALSIGIIEPLVQTVFFNLHERGWKKVRKSCESRISSAAIV